MCGFRARQGPSYNEAKENLGDGGGWSLNLPSRIREIIGDRPYYIDKIGMSDSRVLYFNDLVLKIEEQREESDNEHIMMAWLAEKLPVPKIFCSETHNGINYLLMSRIEGNMSCAPELLENPAKLVRLLASGLKMLWGVDVSECPYNNSIDNKLKLAETRVQDSLCDMEDAEPTTYGAGGFENPEELLQWLKENRPEEELVFSHGDYCLPNIIVKDNRVNGFIDLGRSGIADRYQDIALCYRSLQHNYGGKHGGKVYEGFDPNILFHELQIAPDWNKIRYYILLDELF